jgi:hypothetical protein
VEGLRRALEAIGVPHDYYVARKRANMLIGELLLKNVSREIFVAPEQIRRYFREHPEKFPRPGRTVLRHLLIYADASPQTAIRVPTAVSALAREGWGMERARALAQEVRGRALEPGADFAALAREWTMGDHAESGGLYVFGETVDLLDPVGEIAQRMKPGEISEPIASRVGYHIVQIVERRPAGVLPFEDVQREIEARLKSEAWQERLRAWIKRLREDSEVSVYLPSEAPGE